MLVLLDDIQGDGLPRSGTSKDAVSWRMFLTQTTTTAMMMLMMATMNTVAIAPEAMKMMSLCAISVNRGNRV